MSNIYEIVVTMNDYSTFSVLDTNKEELKQKKNKIERRGTVKDVSKIHEHEAPIQAKQHNQNPPIIQEY